MTLYKIKFIVEMNLYKSKKIKFNENINFIKQYIKDLLLSIKCMNDKKYVHRDIKPKNFLYLNSNEYWLIDFDISCKIGG